MTINAPLGPLSGVQGARLDSSDKTDPAKLARAAQEFESLLIGQMLRMMRDASLGGGLGLEGDNAGRTMSEFADQQLSELLASRGGIGLAALIAQGLQRESQPHRLTGTGSRDD